MAGIHVFTSAAANYLPKVKVLFDSLARHHPEWNRHLLLVEDWSEAQVAEIALAASVLQPRDLAIPDWRPWAFCHTMVELCTAVKPFTLGHLLRRESVEAVIYLDPDICVYSRLDEVLEALETCAVALTPHQTRPETTLSGVMANELTSLRYGTYNLGFIAVAAREEGRRFTDWWSSRTYRFCRNDVGNGLFTDQRWIDLVPGLFEGVKILRHPRLNVASWNAHLRELELDEDGGVMVSGKPLGFYHFTGLDSGNHDVARAYLGGGEAAGRLLLQNYREALAEPMCQYPYVDWSFGRLSDGTEITDTYRQVYRDNADLQLRFPDPWSDAGVLEALSGVEGTEAKPGYVSPGFGVGEGAQIDVARVGSVLARAAAKPASWLALWRALTRVWRREGWRGLRRRLSKSNEERM